MQRYGLIGNVLDYSYSKVIHDFLAAEYNIDMVYELIEVNNLEDINFEGYNGLNVTIPFKEEVLSLLNYVDETAISLGCVNTIDSFQKGFNTDIEGFKYLMEKVNATKYNKIVVLGSGAMAKMIENYYSECDVTLISRDGDYSNIRGEVLINATPISMGDSYNELLVTEDFISSFKAVIDLNYNPQISRFTNIAASNYIPNTNGLDMLLIQAIRAFEIWHEIEVSPIIFNKLKTYILDMINPNVAIIGMPLAGKTTLLEKKDGIDLDDEISTIIGMEINDFIMVMGEEKFRILETQILNDVLKKSPRLLILGGGIVENFENRLILKDYQIKYMDQSLDVLKQRLNNNKRTLIKNEQQLETLYYDRKIKYEYFKTGDYEDSSN